MPIHISFILTFVYFYFQQIRGKWVNFEFRADLEGSLRGCAPHHMTKPNNKSVNRKFGDINNFTRSENWTKFKIRKKILVNFSFNLISSFYYNIYVTRIKLAKKSKWAWIVYCYVEARGHPQNTHYINVEIYLIFFILWDLWL